MKYFVRSLLVFLFLLLGLNSCFKIKTYPPEPSVEYISFVLVDSTDALNNQVLYGELHFSFVDGDGDLGFVESTDTALESISKTIFITPFRKLNGVFVQDTPIIPMHYRMPYFETGGNNKTLLGEIIVKDLNYYPPFSGDTIKYEFYIKDRAGNFSNIEETEEVIIE